MFSRILAFPFMIGAIVFLYLSWEVSDIYAPYIIPFVVLLAVILIFGPQINWWWYQKYPPKLDAPILHLFRERLPFYQKLSTEDKKRFEKRVALFMEAKDFKPQVIESVPEDIKAFVAASAVQLTFGQEEYLLPKYDNVVIFPKPFPSPQYPENLHASEIFAKDGVVLFSAEQLIMGYLEPQRAYNIGLHEYAKIFVESYPQHPYPEFGDDVWASFEKINGFSKAFITEWINLDPVDPLPVSICLFFVFPQRFKVELPEVYATYVSIFKQGL